MPYDENNSGTLGRNKKKTEPNHPDHTGTLKIDGVEYWINAWVKENKTTKEKFFSLSVKEKQSGSGQRSRPAASEEASDDIPF